MSNVQSDTTPYWSTSATSPQYAKLAGDARADVVVVGGGMTGLTAAYLLAKPANAWSCSNVVGVPRPTPVIPARI
jgi:hypothetical protein